MRWFIWVLVFAAYLLVFTGIFLLLSNITKGIKIEVNVKRVVYGETVTRKQEVEFNDAPVVRRTIGTLGLFIAMGVSYMTANFQSKVWGSDDERKTPKFERVIWISVFTVLFLALSLIFKIYTIIDIASLTGMIFMVLLCAGSYTLSTFLCSLPAVKAKFNTAENEVI